MIGKTLGQYQITAKLGEGGMGEVYRATDSKLKREVAIKVLPAAFIADPERLARFEREAQLLAQLHHPNIASIFGLEDATGVRALVMELVEGEDLSSLIARGPVPLAEALGIARQIAEALEAAHEKGIVHRDLKPQNVKVSAQGAVKVLDFGLAKAMDAASAASSPVDLARSPTMMNSPTLTAIHGTQLGVILGTAAYMSPEQARGGAVDKRADIWAFGVVLYEMLGGRSLFAGDTVSDMLAAVLKTEIDFSRLPAETPFGVRQILTRCLERNPKNRLHDIADARIALDEVIAGRPDAATASTAAPRSRRWWPAITLLAGGLVIGSVGSRLANRSPAPDGRPAQATRFAIAPPAGTSYQRGVAISPDGRKIAFTALGADGHVGLWVRELEALEAHELPETNDARYPFWAPDSRRIGFFAQRSLKWTDSAGGSPLILAPTASVQEVRGAAWGADDTVLYTTATTGPILAVSAKGGESRPATRLTGDIGTTRFPTFLPDGRRFIYYASPGTGTEPANLYLGRLGSLDAKLLGPAHSGAVFAEPDWLLYVRGTSLVVQRFDDRREELVSSAVSLGVPMGGSLAVSGLRSIAVAKGMLAYRNDRRNASQLVWVDRAGRELEALSDATSTWYYAPRLSPDDRFLLAGHYSVPSANLGEIWIQDLQRKLATRVTADDGDNSVGMWVRPGANEFLYNSVRTGNAGAIYRIARARPGEDRLWLAGDKAQNPTSSTPDGRRVVFERTEALGQVRLWIRDLDGDNPPTRLGSSTANESSGDVSPDGKWLALVSDASHASEVYVRALDGSGSTVRISNEGGSQPLWRRDGRELFYVDATGHLVTVPMVLPSGADAADPRPGLPQVLFQARLEEGSDRQYDAAADGQRFVLNRSVNNDDAPIVVVLDWQALLEGKAP